MYAEYEENARYTFIKIEVKINSNFINCSQKKSVKKTVFFQKTIENCMQFLEWQPILRHFFSCAIFKFNRAHIIKSSMNSFIVKPINISC